MAVIGFLLSMLFIGIVAGFLARLLVPGARSDGLLGELISRAITRNRRGRVLRSSKC